MRIVRICPISRTLFENLSADFQKSLRNFNSSSLRVVQTICEIELTSTTRRPTMPWKLLLLSRHSAKNSIAQEERMTARDSSGVAHT